MNRPAAVIGALIFSVLTVLAASAVNSPATPEASAATAKSAGGEARAAARGGKKKLKLGFADPAFRKDAIRGDLVRDAAAVNASMGQVWLSWRDVAPVNPPQSFNPNDPNDRAYNWGTYDAMVRDLAAQGIEPVILIYRAPDYAEGANRPADVEPGSWKPQPKAVAAFATALARRYSGRVRNYVFWNEPNLDRYLTPVFGGKNEKKAQKKGLYASPKHYVKMLNGFYEGIKKVSKKNQVIAGATAPYATRNIRPLPFWMDMLCLEGKAPKKLRKEKKCGPKPKFDVAAHHPINTNGGPRAKTEHPDEIVTSNLKKLVKVIRFAERKKTVRGGKHPIWANELWWETDPPDPSKKNPSLKKQAQWMNEGFYTLWKQGASVIMPFQVRDETFFGGPGLASYQSGVYFVDGRPKPSAQVMNFPFIADRMNKRKVLLWGLAPTKGKVLIERKKGKGFKKLTEVRSRNGQIFKKQVRLKGKQSLQATIKGETSMAWKVGKR